MAITLQTMITEAADYIKADTDDDEFLGCRDKTDFGNQ